MKTKILFFGVGMILTLVVLWQASQAGRIRPVAVRGEGSISKVSGTHRHQPDSVIAEGRVVTYPGAEVIIAVERPGLIINLPVVEKSLVHKGDLIVELNCEELCASRDEALARIAEAEAEKRFYELEVERRHVLVAKGTASEFELQTHQRGLDVAKARLKAAQAARRNYEALINKTRIKAPINGVVIARYANPGETVDASSRIVAIADLNRVRVEAEVDEIDIGAITLGMEVIVSAEGFPGRTWRGQVEEIPDRVEGRRLRPEDTSRPTDTRVLLVKVRLLEATPLKLGQRIEVEIHRIAG